FFRIAKKQNVLRSLKKKEKRVNNELKRIIGHLAASSAFVVFSTPLVVSILIRMHYDRVQHGEAHIPSTFLSKLFTSFKANYYAMEFFIFFFFMPNFRAQLAEMFCISACCISSRLGQWALKELDSKTRKTIEKSLKSRTSILGSSFGHPTKISRQHSSKSNKETD
ncbi:hypothetical protein Ciccas_014070, partial [Cichlidogyrus casuarinus]